MLAIPEAHRDCVAASGERAVFATSEGFVEVDGDRIAARARGDEQGSTPEDLEFMTACATGPEGGLFLLTARLFSSDSGKQGTGEIYRLVSRVWTHELELGDHWQSERLHTWSNHRWLALALNDSLPRARFYAPGAAADVPRLEPSIVDAESSALAPSDFASLSTGDVFVVGRLRAPQTANAHGAWERFAPGSPKGTLEELRWNDDADLHPCCVRARAANDVWMAGGTANKHGFVSRWDGRSFEYGSLDEEVKSFDIEPDGTIWAATETKLRRGVLGGTFEIVPLPSVESSMGAASPRSVWAEGPGDVWLAVEASSALRVFRTRPTAGVEPLAISAEEQRIRERRTDALQRFIQDPRHNPAWYPLPYTRGCETPFVMIFDLPKTAAADYDYAATARALKGVADLGNARFVEYARNGQRHFGARAPDAATAKKIAAALAGTVKPRPSFVCFSPAATRRIDFDLTSGVFVGSGPP